MSFLDGLFLQNGLRVANEHISGEDGEGPPVAPGWLYQIDASEDSVGLLIETLPLAEISGKRFAFLVVGTEPVSPDNVVVVVPSGQQIQGDDGSFGSSFEVLAGQVPGNYREWICDDFGRWLMVVGATGGGSGELAVSKDGVGVGVRAAVNFITGANTALTVADNGGAERVDITVAAKATIAKAGVDVGTRSKVNFIDGSGASATCVDNPGSDRVDITLTATATAFDIAAEIAPLHRWRASVNVQSGGLVDSLTDTGSSPKDFAQTGSARAPVATDGNGKTYLALDGAADYYQAGAVADWVFLHDGTSPWTIAIVYHRNALLSAHEILLDTCNFATASIGMSLFLDYATAATQGIRNFIANGFGGQSPIGCTSRVPDTALACLVLRYTGEHTSTAGAGNTTIPLDMMLRRRGYLAATSTKNGFNYVSSNPSFTLTLGRQANTAGAFSAARIYEVMVDNKAWSDRQVLGFESYAKSEYSVAV